MVLPLIGVLGAMGVGGTMLKPHLDNYASRTRGRYREGVLGDASTPDQTDRNLFGGGLLDPEAYSRNVNSRAEGIADRNAAMARQQVASGPGYMNAQLARERFEVEQAEIERVNADKGRLRDWTRGQMEEQGTDAQRQAAQNPFTPGSVIDTQTSTFVTDMARTEEERLAQEAAAVQDQATVEAASNQAQLQEQEDAMLREDGFVDDTYYTPGSPARTWAVEEAYKARGIGAEPQSPLIPTIDEGLRVLDGVKFDRLSSTENANMVAYLNEVMSQLRMDYWQNTLGRTDAPGELEARELQELFPEIGPAVWDDRQRALTRQVFERAKVRAQGGTPTADLPAGWVAD